MRTTVDIPDALYQKLKTKAAREKRSVRELILRSVEGQVSSRTRRKARRVVLPLVRSKRPGKLEVDNDKIYDLISFP